MSVHKRKRKGKITWLYKFDGPGSTRDNRRIVRGFGFATKGAAQDAESKRRIDEEQKFAMAKAGVGVAAEPPKTLSSLLEEFFRQHAEKKLAPNTIERYHEQAACLHPDLLAMPLTDITPLHLSREWNRLLESGGHHRKTKKPRPLAAKTVRSIAGVVSSAFRRAELWGLVTSNPVRRSEPPVAKKHEGLALLPAEQARLVESATGPWCLPMFLDLSAATGARRGELLALRWCDIRDGCAFINRSLTQTKEVLSFKSTKSGRPRRIELPGSALSALEAHRQRQDEFRRQFGPDYRADLDLIFANPDGTLLKPDSISASVSLLCRRLGLPKGASLHTLRHSYASVLLADGVDLATVSERLPLFRAGHGRDIQPRDARPRPGSRPAMGRVDGPHLAGAPQGSGKLILYMGDQPISEEVRLALNLSAAFTATRENIGLDYARKKYGHEPVSDYWVAVARMVIEDLIMRPGRLPRTPPIVQ